MSFFLDKDILQYPFYTQNWTNEALNDPLLAGVKINNNPILEKSISVDNQPWWQQIYKLKNGLVINNIINELEKGWLAETINFKKLKQDLKSKNLGTRHYLSLYSMISSHLVYNMRAFSKSNVDYNRGLVDTFKEKIGGQQKIAPQAEERFLKVFKSENTIEVFNLSKLDDISTLNSVENINELTIKDGVLKLYATNHDPHFVLPNMCSDKRGKIIITIKIVVEEQTQLQFFYRKNAEDGYAEENSILKIINTGINNIYLEIDEFISMDHLRIDPGNVKGEYSILDLTVYGYS